MHALSASDVIIRAVFWLTTIILAGRAWIVAIRWRKLDGEVPQRAVRSRRFASKYVFALLVICFLALGVTSFSAGRHWLLNARAAKRQKSLSLDLHIPHVTPNRTYTLVAKFSANGRPYVTHTALHIKFGAQRPVYHVTLYYDAANPEVNGWTPLQPPAPSELNRVLISAIGFLIVAALLLEWLALWWIDDTISSAASLKFTL